MARDPRSGDTVFAEHLQKQKIGQIRCVFDLPVFLNYADKPVLSGLHSSGWFRCNLLLRTQIVRTCWRRAINLLAVGMIGRTHSVVTEVIATAGCACVVTQMIAGSNYSLRRGFFCAVDNQTNGRD